VARLHLPAASNFFQISDYTITGKAAGGLLRRPLQFALGRGKNVFAQNKAGYVFLFTSSSAVLHARWNQGAQTYPDNLHFYSLYRV